MPSPLPASVEVLTRAVSAQFASRPTLRSVLTRLLEEQIIENTAPLDTDVQSLYVALPNNAAGYDVVLLIDVALDYLASGDAPDFASNIDGRLAHLVDAAGRKVTYPQPGDTHASTWPDMSTLENIIRELPAMVHIGFQEALTTYWNAPGTSGGSRWRWVGDQLGDSLRSAAIGRHATDPMISETLTEVVNHPDRLGRAATPAIHVYCLETRLSKDSLSAKVLSPDLLITRDRRVLHCRVCGVIEPYASMDDFVLAWQQALSGQLAVDDISLKRYELDSNLFDTQAALLLNQQLEDLAAIKLPARSSASELEQLFSRVTDPAPAFLGEPGQDLGSLRRVQATLPAWLRTAPVPAQLAYRRHSLELASVRQASRGKSWSEGIDSLRVFAAKRLHQQMRLDQPLAPGYQPDELELTFAVPVGDLGSGYIERLTMTLTDLALKNLSGKPRGTMTIRHTGGQLIEDWTTADYLLDLVSRVDIGKAYPQLISDLLLTDTQQSSDRQRLFGDELKVMLPLTALELAVKGDRGFTPLGYRFITALVQPTRAERIVDEDEIVIRPLAFRRKPDAEPDVVDNMFLIEPADSTKGPCLLYRPLYAQSLQQFPHRASLLAAIVAPGALQESVLSWLADRARPIYAHGGFREPHIVHFTSLDLFGLPDKPEPATLASDTSGHELLQSLRSGHLMDYLFGSNARALVDLADRETVSNAESRWAILLEGGWLLFNTLLALPLSPPVMLVGWMVSLTSSLAQDIPALDSDDATARELALVDLLLNIAMVLLHGTQPVEFAGDAADLQGRSRLALDPLRRPANHPATDLPAIGQGPIGLPAEPPGGGQTPLDFDKSLARESSAARLLDKLLQVRVEWPKEPVQAIDIGPFKGLYRIAQQWHASVAGMLFQVSIVPGFAEVFIVHPEKPDHPGIKLKTDGKGHWTLDPGLKLLGGGPKKRIAALRAELASTLAPMLVSKAQLVAHLTPLRNAQNEALIKLRDARTAFESKRSELVKAWKKVKAASPPDTQTTQEHQHWQEQTRTARVVFEVALRRLQQRMVESYPARRELIDTLRQMRGIDNAAIYENEQLFEVKNLATAELVLGLLLREHGKDIVFTARGEDLNELSTRVNQDLPQGQTAAYEEYIALEKLNLERSQAMIDNAVRYESILEEMAQISPTGAAERDKAQRTVVLPEVFYATNLKLHTLNTYRELALDRSGNLDNPTELYFMSQMVGTELRSACIAHLEMRNRNGFSPDERIAIYENVIKQYEHNEHVTHSLQDIGSSHLRTPYAEKFLQRLAETRLIAEQDLAATILEVEETKISLPSTALLRKKTDSKRVFKSRNKGTLIGDVRQQKSAAGEELIDILDPQSGAIVSTFHKHPQEGTYVELIDAPPPTAIPPRRSATAAIEAGNRLMLERARREGMIQREIRQLNDPVLREEKNPQEWHTLLEQIAVELESISSELAQVQPITENTTNAMQAFRAEASDLRANGQRYRNEGYKKQAPTADKVFTLWRNGALDIQPLKARELTRAKDFLSEYAIRDKTSNEVLWYAHFHYASKTDAELAYVAGHLKRADQRTLGFKAQLRQAADNKEVVRIWRSRVSPDMAKKLFFYSA
jgi:hypothetical protein